MWIGGSSAAAVRRTARYGTGWQAGAETPADVGRVIGEIKVALVEAGRSIDEDHYGSAFAYRFGRWEDASVAPVMEAYLATRAAGEAAIADAGITATVLRPWYVLGPGHRWPVLLIPLYATASVVPSITTGSVTVGSGKAAVG